MQQNKKAKPGFDWRSRALPKSSKASDEESAEKGAISRIEISIAENGFEVECRHKPPKTSGKKSEMACCDYDSMTSRYVFSTPAEVAQFLSEKLA